MKARVVRVPDEGYAYVEERLFGRWRPARGLGFVIMARLGLVRWCGTVVKDTD